MFGLCINQQTPSTTPSDLPTLVTPSDLILSDEKTDDVLIPTPYSFSEDESIDVRETKLHSSSVDSETPQNVNDSPKKLTSGEAEYRKALNDMLLLQFRQFADAGQSFFHQKSNNLKKTRRYSV